MILDFILNLYIDIYYALLDGIPYAVFPDGWLQTFATIQDTIGKLQTIFPIDVGLAILAVVIFIESTILGLKISNSLYTKLPGAGS